MTSRTRAHLRDAIDTALRRVVAVGTLSRYQDARAVDLTLSTCEGVFVNLLELHGPLAPGRLGQLTGLSSGTVTGVLDRLERAGHVRRDRAPKDRRAVIVSLTAPPYPFLEGDETPKLADLDTDYTEEQLRVIADFLRRLTDGAPGLRPSETDHECC